MDKVIEFVNTYDLANDLIEFAEEGLEVSAVVTHDVAECLLKDLILNDESLRIAYLDFESEEFGGYEKEYIIEIANGEIWLEKLYKNDTYVSAFADVLFVEEGVAKNTYKDVKADKTFIFTLEDYPYFDDDDECDGNCENCKHTFEKEDVATTSNNIYRQESQNGLTQSWTDGNGSYFSRSFYSSNNEEMRKIKEEWERFAIEF